ncbi:MAG TPA: hypothetical protein PKO06_11920, partial [Candidatus Ozemobacteraceae bacterium]|nr:hypothetical protein [Candidatus Ozemobacteraceae bacterium]
RGTGAEEIDGGMEFNGLYLYHPRYRQTTVKSWWWVEKDTFLISFGMVPGYSVVRRYPFTRLFPPRHQSILVLRKTP